MAEEVLLASGRDRSPFVLLDRPPIVLPASHAENIRPDVSHKVVIVLCTKKLQPSGTDNQSSLRTILCSSPKIDFKLARHPRNRLKHALIRLASFKRERKLAFVHWKDRWKIALSFNPSISYQEIERKRVRQTSDRLVETRPTSSHPL